MHKKTHLILFFALLFVFAFSFYQNNVGPSEAYMPVGSTIHKEVFGWAWSGDSAGTQGIGWISMNSKNCANAYGKVNPICGGGDEQEYGVYFDKAPSSEKKVYFHGYAWVGNGGTNPGYYIKFGPSSSVATNRTITGDSAVTFDKEWVYLDTSPTGGNKLKGWARACSVFNDKDRCGDGTDKTLNPNAGGWDGWINMSDAKYAVKYNNTNHKITAKDCKNTDLFLVEGQFGGCAWGGAKTSDSNPNAQIPGWIAFGWNPGGSSCVAPRSIISGNCSCPSGQTWDGVNCIASGSCVAPRSIDASGNCSCSSGLNWNGVNCVGGGGQLCPDGSAWSGVCTEPWMTVPTLTASCYATDTNGKELITNKLGINGQVKWVGYITGGIIDTTNNVYSYEWIPTSDIGDTRTGDLTGIDNGAPNVTYTYNFPGSKGMKLRAKVVKKTSPDETVFVWTSPADCTVAGNDTNLIITNPFGKYVTVNLDSMSAKFIKDTTTVAYKTGGAPTDKPQINILPAGGVDSKDCLPIAIKDFAIIKSDSPTPVDPGKYSFSTNPIATTSPDFGHSDLILTLKGKTNWPAGSYNVSFRWNDNATSGCISAGKANATLNIGKSGGTFQEF